jgi:hypothetical protein
MIRTSLLPEVNETAALAAEKAPFDLIQEQLLKTYPDAPAPKFKWCHGYYERCLGVGQDGKPIAIYFPPAVDYLMDLGYETLVLFKSWLAVHVTGDPTFPHWEEGKFYASRKEERRDILYPFMPQDLLVSMKSEFTVEGLSSLLAPTGVSVVEKTGGSLFKIKAPAFAEDAAAARLRALPEVAYVERNSLVRLIDVSPGWTVDRIF